MRLRNARALTAFAWVGLAGALGCYLVLAIGGAGLGSAAFPTDVERPPPPAFRGALGPIAHAAGLRLTPALVTALVLGASASYLLLLLAASAARPRAVAGVIVLLHLALAAAPPLLSADVFGYLAYARLAVVHGLSPYLHAPAAVPGDPLLPFVGLQGVRSPYGPLFTLGSYALVPLGTAAGLWVLKGVTALAALGCLALVADRARRLGRDARAATVFVGLNPLWLAWGVGGAHNDMLMMAAAMGGITLALRRRPTQGGAFGAVATAVKPTAVLLLPFLIAGASRRRAAAVGVLAGGAVVLAVSLLAFGRGLAGFVDAVVAQSQFVSYYSLPSAVLRGLGHRGASESVRVALTAGALIAVLAAVRAAARGADALTAAGWALLAVVVASLWLYPWYLVWVLPLAGASPSRSLRAATLLASALVVAVRLPLGITSPL